MDCSITCTNVSIYHTQLKLFIWHSGINMHSHKHSFNMFITFINRNIVAEVKMDKITDLMKTPLRNQLRRCNVPPNHRPACSLISQQCCNPQVGHYSPRNKGTSGLHIDKNIQTQPSQHSWVYQAIKELEKANC